MKGKFLPLFLFFSCIIFKASAQIVEPIHWNFSTNKLTDCEVELVIKATLDEGWHLYGQTSTGGDGPTPTSFHFSPDSSYELLGNTSEETLIKKFEPVFDIELNYFEHKALFKQKVKIKTNGPIEIKGNLEFMVCNDVMCMPPSTAPFSFNVKGSGDCTNTQGNSTNASGINTWLNIIMFIILLFLAALFFGAFKITTLSSPGKIAGSIKISSGFLALAFALKFASNADIALQTSILTREVFVSLWIVIFGLLGIYLLGGIKFPQEKELNYLPVSRLFFAVLILSFTIYLIPGLWGAPLKIIKGIPPSYSYSESPEGFGKSKNR